MGDALAAAGNYEAGLEKYHEAEGLVRNRPETDARIREFRGGLLFRMGDAWLEIGEANRALPLYESILSVVEKQFAGDASNAECQRGLASVHWAIGRALKKLGRSTEALEHFERSIPPLMAVIAKDRVNTLFRGTMADVLVDRGEVLAGAGTFGPGVARLEKGVSMWREMVEQDPDDVQARLSWCNGLTTLSRVYGSWARTMEKSEAEEFWWRACDAVVKAAQEWERLKGDERITMAMPPEKGDAIGEWLHEVNDAVQGKQRKPRR
jgi:tetratricopeptide (TPR) repeat protein